MKSGIISLKRLYEYAYKDPQGKSVNGRSPAGREYGRLAKEVTSSIVEMQGFYLWGKYERNGLWRNLYLGKAGFGKTAHLRSRILEELKDEKWAIWSVIMPEDQLMSLDAEYYPTMWEKSYKSHARRGIRKSGGRPRARTRWVTRAGCTRRATSA